MVFDGAWMRKKLSHFSLKRRAEFPVRQSNSDIKKQFFGGLLNDESGKKVPEKFGTVADMNYKT